MEIYAQFQTTESISFQTPYTLTDSSTSGGMALLSKQVEGRRKFQCPVPVVDLAVRSFPRFSPKLA